MNILVSWTMDAKKQRLRELAIGAPAAPPGAAVAAAAAAAAAPAQDVSREVGPCGNAVRA